VLKNTDAAARINERLCAGHGPAAVAAAHSRTLGALSPVVRQAACRVQELLVVLACGGGCLASVAQARCSGPQSHHGASGRAPAPGSTRRQV